MRRYRSGNYKMAMTLTAFIIFLGLFTALYFVQGGYHSGIPAFFIFGVVFTAFLLNGVTMVVLVITELIWYSLLIVYSYYHQQTLNYNEKHYMVRVVLDMVLVALSLAITMYCQIRIYRKKQQLWGVFPQPPVPWPVSVSLKKRNFNDVFHNKNLLLMNYTELAFSQERCLWQ